MKYLINVVGVIIFVVAITWGIFILQNPHTLPFHTIKIEITENNHLDPVSLRKVVTDNLAGGFFSLRVNRLRQALLNMPWIFAVSFRRVWPGELLIHVHEQQVIARWGGDALLNAQGDIFKPALATFPQNLSVLTGPLDSQQELLQHFQQFEQMLW